MTDRSVHHDTVTLSQTYDAPVDRVYRAWSQADELETWYVPGDETWKAHVEHLDFRVDGGKRLTFGPPEVTWTEDCRYLDIVPNKRICYSMTIDRGDTRISVTLVTVEFWRDGDGCGVRITDQGAWLDGEFQEGRDQGWREILGKLDAVVMSPV
jgi:uncharacterized protein YndB with AHSA1/START domain